MSDEDSQLWVKFYKSAVHLKGRSEKEGRPIFEDRDFIAIVVPGSADEHVREVRDDDKVRFHVQWARYQANQEQVQDGTPVDDWAALTASQREELKHLKVYTVEAVAGLSDAQAQKLGPGYMSLRTKASAFLEQAKDSAAAQRFAAENDALRSELADLREQFKALQSQIDRKGKAA